MGVWELILTAVGLSMDAFAVAVCKGLSSQEIKGKYYLWIGLWFGGFQALMLRCSFAVSLMMSNHTETPS